MSFHCTLRRTTWGLYQRGARALLEGLKSFKSVLKFRAVHREQPAQQPEENPKVKEEDCVHLDV